MPAYTYRCEQCERKATATHGVNDLLTPACRDCGGLMRRVLTSAPVVTKGSSDQHKKIDQPEDVAEDNHVDHGHESSGCVLHHPHAPHNHDDD